MYKISYHSTCFKHQLFILTPACRLRSSLSAALAACDDATKFLMRHSNHHRSPYCTEPSVLLTVSKQRMPSVVAAQSQHSLAVCVLSTICFAPCIVSALASVLPGASGVKLCCNPCSEWTIHSSTCCSTQCYERRSSCARISM
jgi:hypothetical protein